MATRPRPVRRIRSGLAACAVLVAALAAAAPRAVDPPAPAPRAVGPRAFTHPGVLLDRSQLHVLRAHVESGAEPWASAYRAMANSRYAQAGYRPRPVAVVACKPYENPPACTAEREDAVAAYTQALLWSVTGKRAHAEKSVQIMDAWSKVLRDHTEGNAGLQAAWAGSTWARAAEIVRHTYKTSDGSDGWPKDRVARFSHMLRHAYLAEFDVKVADYNGNWDLTMTDAALGIGVFLDDRKVFDQALARFRARVPAYFYLRSDGPLPLAPPGGSADTPEKIRAYWFGQRRFVDGLGQESCRNFEHVGYALAATAHTAETAHHQGVDLYGEVRERLRAATELHSGYQLGGAVPQWLCGGKPELTLGPDLEVVLNHLKNRLHVPVPHTERLVRRTRPAGTDDLFVAWETLTHAGASSAPKLRP
ncbi:alginate lyase family protein [Streptomyces cavernicola]|uniref:Alginate lyase family protein n=1 Tax=Streptomyces cavernicola TaxID=3043613 RepID=A0ABT6SLC8_9ACTN|nr:alginate lyase family protein [Streptomyces sp. B-S-A6]MDI3408996.1 alginate lyase family protein [Streptomyces sp. B-S-A6]